MEHFTPAEHREHWPPAWVVKNLGGTAIQQLRPQQQKMALLLPAFEQFADSDTPSVIRGNE